MADPPPTPPLTFQGTIEELYQENLRLRHEASARQVAQPSSANLYYTIAIVSLCLIGVVAIVIVLLNDPARVHSQNDITLILGLLTPSVFVLLGLMQRDTHVAFNSRMTEFLQLKGDASRAEGRLQEQSRAFVAATLTPPLAVIVPAAVVVPPARPAQAEPPFDPTTSPDRRQS